MATRSTQTVQEALFTYTDANLLRATQVVQQALFNYTDANLLRATQSVIQVLRSEVNATPVSIVGALVRLRADLVGVNYSTATRLTWEWPIHDTNGMWSSSAPTRLTVPAELDGYWGFVMCTVGIGFVSAGSYMELEIWKGNAATAYNGMAGSIAKAGTGATIVQCKTQFIQFTKNDFFQASFHTDDASITLVSDSCNFSIFVFGPSVDGCLLRKAADATTQNYSVASMMTWDNEVRDTHAFHDNSTNPSRITIPAAVNGRMGIFKANVRMTSVSSDDSASIAIFKNGSFVGVGLGAQRVQISSGRTEHWIECETLPIVLTTNDYYEVQYQNNDTSVTFKADYSSFGLAVLNVQEGALVKKAADELLFNGSAGEGAVLTWDGSDVYDTHSVHDPSVNNGYFTIPSSLEGRFGIFAAQVNAPLVTGNTITALRIQRNDVSSYSEFGGFSSSGGTYTTGYRGCCTAPVELVAGDVWNARLFSSDASVTLESDTCAMSLWILPLAPLFLPPTKPGNSGKGKDESPGQIKKEETRRLHSAFIDKKQDEKDSNSGRYSSASLVFAYPFVAYTPPDLTQGHRTLHKRPRTITRS